MTVYMRAGTDSKGRKHNIEPGKVVAVGSIPNCYFCEREGITSPGEYDFATRMGPWVNGCTRHWKLYSASNGLGVSKAQLWILDSTVRES